MSNVLTIRHLIDANKTALAKGTLGALALDCDGCHYDYGNGKRCAIGVALSNTQIADVHALKLNNNGVYDLVSKGIVKFPTEAEGAVARFTQDIHDSWASQSRPVINTGILNDRFPALRAFLDQRVGNRSCTEQTFRDWLDLLVKTFPVEAN